MRDPSEADAPRRAGLWGLLRIALSLGLILFALWWVDLERVRSQLRLLSPWWFGVGLLGSVFLYASMAARWSLTASRIGAPLRFGRALSEYYSSVLINQLVPVSVAGDAMRVYRHKKALSESGTEGALGKALRAILLERLAGQLALAMWMIGAALYWWQRGIEELALLGLGFGLLIFFFIPLLWWLRRRREGSLGRFARDAERALAAPGILLLQLVLSLLSASLLILMFVAAGVAIDSGLHAPTLLALAPLIIGITTLPLGFGGWGIRELSSAGLFEIAGMDASIGVSVSVAYGLMSLLSSAPGLLSILRMAAPEGGEETRGAALGYPALLFFGALASVLVADLRVFAFVGLAGLLARTLACRGRWTPSGRFGAANAVTWLRILFCGAWALAAMKLNGLEAGLWAIGILIMDAVDGRIARHMGLNSDFGAELDMESDAYFVMLLSLMLWQLHGIGAFVLAAGFWRYGYALVVGLVPPMGEAPRSQFARYVFFVLVVCLALAFVLPWPTNQIVAALGVSAVSLSFLRSLFYSWRPQRS